MLIGGKIEKEILDFSRITYRKKQIHGAYIKRIKKQIYDIVAQKP